METNEQIKEVIDKITKKIHQLHKNNYLDTANYIRITRFLKNLARKYKNEI